MSQLLRQLIVMVISLSLQQFLFAQKPSKSPDGVTFKNAGGALLHVIAVTGEGSCPSKPQPVREVFALNPGESRTIVASGSQKEVCYAASRVQAISQFVLYCGTTKASNDVEFSAATPLCSMKLVETNLPTVSRSSISTVGDRSVIERSVTSWNDPLTPPQTATRCIREAWGHWPWCENWRTCTEWATDCRFMRNELFLIVSSPNTSPESLRRRTDECLQTAAVGAALAGVAAAYSGGNGVAAAEQAFREIFLLCMSGIADLGVRFDQRSHWTPWGSCTK